jgi:predicted enzyme related to lactoylglutathione lyase
MIKAVLQCTLFVHDQQKAKVFYTEKLGFDVRADEELFQTDNIEEDFANMKARGIIFHGGPQSVPGGKGVGFEDLYGNKLDIFEPEKRRGYR